MNIHIDEKAETFNPKASTSKLGWALYKKVTLPTGKLLLGEALPAPWEPVFLTEKAPFMPEWQKGEITPDSLSKVYWANKNRITGVGLRTGHLAVVDIDSTDDSLTEVIHAVMLEKLGPGALYRRGSKGLAALYWNENPIGKLLLTFSKGGVAQKLEILGQGQQMGGFGHVKETEKAPAFDYKWLDGQSPLDLAPFELPGVTGEALREFLEAVKVKLIELGWTIGKVKDDKEAGKSKSASTGGLVSSEMLEKMLGCIDPGQGHDDCLPVIAALKQAEEAGLVVHPDTFEPDENFSGRETAVAWSRGEYQPEQEAPTNYADGWAEKRYDSLDGVTEGGTTLATLVKMACDGGYKGHTRIDTLMDRLPPDDELRMDSELPPDFATAGEKDSAAGEKSEQPRVKVYLDNEVVENSKKYVPQIIPGWLTASGFTLLVGGKRVGKTTLAVDMIGRIINDEDFYGRKTLKGWSVGYIAAEDVPGTKARLAANAVHSGGLFVKAGNHHRFAWYEERIDLRKWEQVKAVADAFMLALGRRKDILVVIDTYGKCLPVDQSDETATKEASANIVKLAKYVQGAVLVLGQPSRHGERAISGSGVLENDAEGLIWLQHRDPDTKSTAARKIGVTVEAIDMKNCDSGSRLEMQIVSTVTDPNVRDQEGNLVSAGYASVLQGWNAKGKEIENCPDFKKFIHPNADVINKVQGLDRGEAMGLEGEQREVYEDGVRARTIAEAICGMAKKAGVHPDGFGVDQRVLLEHWDNPNTVSPGGVPMLKRKTMLEHMAAGRILNRMVEVAGEAFVLKRRAASGGKSGGGRKAPELYLVAAT